MLDLLADRIAAALGENLVGLYVHGSYVAGDFEPARSDLDLLAVLRGAPDATTLELLRPLHARTAVEHPEWADRVEVDYVSTSTLARLAEQPGPMIRISPGEPLHLFEATRHYLFNVASARSGIALQGPSPTAVIPPVGDVSLRAVVREHAASWPAWVQDSRGRVGAQAYAVLTLCRLLHHEEVGTQLSKRQAATWGRERLREQGELIGWASRWWYHGGTDADPERFAEVETFVRAVSSEISAHP